MDPYEKSKMFTKRYKKIKTLLKMVYGYDSFRSKQYEIINRIICGEDVCAIMPTGVGKSICFQIPALYIDKPAIIISPLISLMDDQRLILEELGISSCCYNSNVANKSQMKKDILQCKYKFIYITPESIVNMKDFFQKLEEKQGISLIAIDEAHCISSYGFDFRKSYRELTFFKEILPNIPILAVTATATNIVGKDICKVLGFKNHTPIKTSFDRPNLYLEVREKSKNIGSDIISVLKKYENKSVIIYCLTKKETAKIAEILKMHKIKCGIYHAGLDVEDKKKAHHDFIKGNVKVIAATIAFGMGINKADVRAVIHYGAPKNIEGYYQEIGRAGRDGKKAYCYAFYNFRDFKVQEGFIANSNDGSYQKNQLKLLEQMKRYMLTKQCRRQILLEYFDEDANDKCDFCDNCCGVHKKMDVTIIKTEQDVQKEAKLLIDLIESVKGKSFGIGMYINILRGSTNKSITSIMKKSKFYGSGKHRSAVWWKEMSDNLIKQGFLQQVYLKGGRFAMQVIKTTKQGIMWANMADLNGMLDGLGVVQLEPMKMVTTI
ncbi:putative ATP-dependent RNA helicase [Tupanvirus soda lake]|uniref:ATP-dependent RNA helicase n=2 Tax=Tupanvirus TaxID=2094720 RepID=A0AC62AB76_9VIRU|nr:putative ATP-dependent RNA helicase [Tupanvirus soda lake]QKU35011.1 putative ATP-dependent RNA helicase [Tupanvirus soda lake]